MRCSSWSSCATVPTAAGRCQLARPASEALRPSDELQAVPGRCRHVASDHLVDVVGCLLRLVRRPLERLLGPLLDARRWEREQHPRRLRAGVAEAVHRAAGDVDEVVRAGDGRLLAEEDLDLPREDVVGLVLAGKDVRGPPPGVTSASVTKYAPPDSSPVTRNV